MQRDSDEVVSSTRCGSRALWKDIAKVWALHNASFVESLATIVQMFSTNGGLAEARSTTMSEGRVYKAATCISHLA